MSRLKKQNWPKTKPSPWALKAVDRNMEDAVDRMFDKLTGAWTVEGKAIWNDCKPVGIATSSQEAHQIADAHNAALAAGRMAQAHDDRKHWEARVYGLEQQLADEREKSKSDLRSIHELAEHNLQLREQLAAERERLEKEWGREGIHITVERLERELAAEREKVHQLMCDNVVISNQLTDEREKRELVRWCVVHYPEELMDCCPCCEAVNERNKVEQLEKQLERLGDIAAELRRDKEHVAEGQRAVMDDYEKQLAAERSLRETAQSNAELWHEEMLKTDKKLAAEAWKVGMFIDALNHLRQNISETEGITQGERNSLHGFIDTTLAKVKEKS